MRPHAHADRYLVAAARRARHVALAQRNAHRCLFAYGLWLVLAESRVAGRGDFLRARQGRRIAAADAVCRSVDHGRLAHLLEPGQRVRSRTLPVGGPCAAAVEPLVGASTACLLPSVHHDHRGSARQAPPLVAAAGVRGVGELSWRSPVGLRAPRRRSGCADGAGARHVAAGGAGVSRMHGRRHRDATGLFLLVRDPEVPGTHPSLSAGRVAPAASDGRPRVAVLDHRGSLLLWARSQPPQAAPAST